jgi:hypothetical protein
VYLITKNCARDKRGNEPTCKPDPVPDHSGGEHPSRAAVANGLVRSTSKYQAGRSFAQISSSSKTQFHPLDLAPGGVYLATAVTCGTGGLLHHRFTLTKVSLGGLFSVALSRGLPRVGVTHHLALWSPDFPRQLLAAITQPTRSTDKVIPGTIWNLA